MNVLIVLAQPDTASFSAAVAEAVRKGAESAGHTVEVANLVTEGFDPRELQPDLDRYHGKSPAPPEDVLREQARVDRADALVVVFPIYWWSMPAILKGWIDRVFIWDWAFKIAGGKVVGTMRDIPVHVIGVGGGNDDGYEKHGYGVAFKTQIEHGIFRFCGLKRVDTHLLLESESANAAIREAHLKTAFGLGEALPADSTVAA